MNWGRTLALTMCGADAIIGLVYGCQRDVRMCIYWVAAAVLTAAVSW